MELMMWLSVEPSTSLQLYGGFSDDGSDDGSDDVNLMDHQLMIVKQPMEVVNQLMEVLEVMMLINMLNYVKLMDHSLMIMLING